ncbi:MAG: caspase family protein [Candidatus Obscuribacterales bacterium]|nr:caspase family protein [Candidatus Obscuribacterales bacterium]
MKLFQRNCRASHSNKNIAPLVSLLLAMSFTLVELPCAKAIGIEGGPKDLFYRQLRDTSPRPTNIGMTYSIELIRNNKTTKADSRFPFKSGDQIRFHVQSNIDGYMYVVMKSGSKGTQAVLFPAVGSSENNEVKKGTDYILPEQGVLEFDNTPGEEHLQLIVSATKLNLENAISQSRERSIVIRPKSPITKQPNTLVDLPAVSNVSWSAVENPPSFKEEPAVTVVSTEATRPLSLEVMLRHEGAVADHLVATNRDGKPSKPQPAKPVDKIASSPTRSAALPSATPDAATKAATGVVSDKWALVVGISKFQDPQWNLLYADKDARDFAKFLTDECNFAPDHVKLLTNNEATRTSILTELGARWLPANAKAGDLVVIYFATHGTNAKQDVAHKNFLVAHDTDPTNPFVTGIEIQDLARTIKRRIEAERVLIVLDTCHAGVAEAGAKALPSAAPKFDFKDLVQGTGQLIVASSAANQSAHDSLRYKNGVFTKHFIEGLRTHSKFADAFTYTCKQVEDETLSDFAQRQTPVLKDAEWKGDELKVSAPPSQPRAPQK